MSPRKRRFIEIATRALIATALALLLSILLAEPFSMSTSSIFASAEKKDFQMTDLFAQIADNRPVRQLDDRIVIVNIGLADRTEIGEALGLVSLFAPKVVGVDVNFRDSISPETDEILMEGINSIPGIVLPLQLAVGDDGTFDIAASPFFFEPNQLSEESPIQYGAANLPAKSHRATIREYVVYFETKGGKIPSFITRIAESYDKKAADRLRARGEKLGTTAYHSREYRIINIDEIEDNAEAIADKIVLFGALDDASDMHATPVNSYMAGILIHAHALSTVLDGTWYRKTPPAFDYLLAAFICLIITFLSYYLHSKFRGITLRLLQVVLIILAVRIGYGAFVDSNILFNFTYTFLIIAFGLFAVDICNGVEQLGLLIYRKFQKRKNNNKTQAI